MELLPFFADNSKNVLRIASPQSYDLLQSYVNNINNWCMENKLYLNIDKCSITSIKKMAAVTNYDDILLQPFITSSLWF